ncbi:hypothetical protein KUCAC02_036417 [Chaenocephalus aceratus]|nr:hypothetical protein KUCAC02_036417 [Chaenocephalus aceratus]
MQREQLQKRISIKSCCEEEERKRGRGEEEGHAPEPPRCIPGRGAWETPTADVPLGGTLCNPWTGGCGDSESARSVCCWREVSARASVQPSPAHRAPIG